MCNEHTDICFCTAQDLYAHKQKKAPFAPRPAVIASGGVTQNFPPIPCTHCADGWITQPDGYGCIEWTLCYRCNGEGVFR